MKDGQRRTKSALPIYIWALFLISSLINIQYASGNIFNSAIQNIVVSWFQFIPFWTGSPIGSVVDNSVEVDPEDTGSVEASDGGGEEPVDMSVPIRDQRGESNHYFRYFNGNLFNWPSSIFCLDLGPESFFTLFLNSLQVNEKERRSLLQVAQRLSKPLF